MFRTFINNFFFTSLLIVSAEINAVNLPASYVATYDVLRGGKIMAEQTSTFKSSSTNTYQLTDATKGTKGLASLTGFQRTETTHFQIEDGQTTAIEHKMQQQVAFSSKSYQFKAPALSSTINGKSKKKTFSIQADDKPISAHLLPLWLSSLACDQETTLPSNIQILVLKSKRIKTYQFSLVKETEQLVRADRIFPLGSKRSSEIWFDLSKSCLAIKSRHIEEDEPVIETRLKNHLKIKNNSNY